jgi:hypothetical protein
VLPAVAAAAAAFATGPSAGLEKVFGELHFQAKSLQCIDRKLLEEEWDKLTPPDPSCVLCLVVAGYGDINLPGAEKVLGDAGQVLAYRYPPGSKWVRAGGGKKRQATGDAGAAEAKKHSAAKQTKRKEDKEKVVKGKQERKQEAEKPSEFVLPSRCEIVVPTAEGMRLLLGPSLLALLAGDASAPPISASPPPTKEII